jgi:hypothetical protein
MSAFIIEDKVINSVVFTLASYRGYGDFPLMQTIAKEQALDLRKREDCEKLGNAMFALNCSAIDQRYGADQAKEFRDLDYSYRLEPHQSTMQAYKSLGCWLYQCAEGDIRRTGYDVDYRSVYDLAGKLAARAAREATIAKRR